MVYSKFTLALALLTATVRVWTIYWPESFNPRWAPQMCFFLAGYVRKLCASVEPSASPWGVCGVSGEGGVAPRCSRHTESTFRSTAAFSHPELRGFDTCVSNTQRVEIDLLPSTAQHRGLFWANIDHLWSAVFQPAVVQHCSVLSS